MTYEVPDDDLKPWELRIRRWMEKHPSLAQRIDGAIERGTDRSWAGAVLMVMIGVVPTLLLAVVSLLLAVFVGHPWNWITGAFAFTALFMSVAACVVWREDHARAAKHP